MPTVSIDGNSYDVYVSLADANIYLAAQISSAGDAWRAATDTVKSRGIVSATRLLDRQSWAGTPVGGTHAFPREGLTYCNGSGDVVPSNAVPQEVVDATSELAAMLVEDPSIQGSPSTQNGIQSLKAGSVSIAYFRIDPALFARLPTAIQELLGCWLQGFDAITAGTAFGTDRQSQFEDEFLFNDGV